MEPVRKGYVPPVITTIDSSEIIQSIGPAQSYGHQMLDGTGMMMGSQPKLHSPTGGR